MKSSQNDVTIRVECTNALTLESDILVLKYAQELYGLDWEVVDRLERAGVKTRPNLPRTGHHHLVNSMNQIGARSILFVGVEELFYFRYREIREFARRALTILSQEAHETKRICVTLHGANYGLDEVEAFESELAGLADAISTRCYPSKLEEIIIVEGKQERVERLERIIYELFPGGYFPGVPEQPLGDNAEAASERLRSAGYSSDSKPRIFVAMPFAEEINDVYDYGIKGAVNDAGFMCERADLSTFTGDILDWVKRRIETSTLVIADLTGANPNVYLEVGYAWGAGVPTILIVRDSKELKFDVQGQRCLVYKRIKDLEESLRKELKGIRVTMAI